MATLSCMRAYALRCEVSHGPASSLAQMPVRNGLVLELVDSDDASGWGEVWCNFPPNGNVSRLNLLADVIWPALKGQMTNNPGGLCDDTFKSAERMRIHTGESGPYRHCLSGVDMALHDLAARRKGIPLAKLLTETPDPAVNVYASTPSGACLAQSVIDLAGCGHRATKLKVGYGLEQDLNILREFRSADSGLAMFIDANQSWDIETAKTAISAFAEFSPGFIEEPLLATAPIQDWHAIAQHSHITIAAGENVTSLGRFRDLITYGALGIAQPDLAKWGGITGAMAVAKSAADAARKTCLHFMGTGVGLAASLHVAAALKDGGYVELDANPNPLRTDVCPLGLTLNDGKITVPAGAGMGVSPSNDALKAYTIASFERR